MAKILIIRFSAINDVAMTIPVICSFAMQYPQHQIVFLSQDALAPLFEGLPENIYFHGIDLEKKYKGWLGMKWLYDDLKGEQFDVVVDFQKTIASSYLRWHFRFSGIKVVCMTESHREMQQLTRRKHKVIKPLPSRFDRYAEALCKAGYPIQSDFISLFKPEGGNISCLQPLTGEKGENKWIGIAPFAPFVGKIYPLSRQEQVIKLLSAHPNTKIFLFGGGRKEIEVLEKWASQFPNVVSTAGKLTLNMELVLMSRMDVMLTMDSANMHLASLVNIPVLSVWGATHPFTRFAGWKQPVENAIQIDLPCRPCSIFGDKPCFRKDYACMQGITPELIVQHILNIID